LGQADRAIVYQPDNLGWDLSQLLKYAGNIEICNDLESIISTIKAQTGGACHVLLMSNGSFGGIYKRLRDEL